MPPPTSPNDVYGISNTQTASFRSLVEFDRMIRAGRSPQPTVYTPNPTSPMATRRPSDEAEDENVSFLRRPFDAEVDQEQNSSQRGQVSLDVLSRQLRDENRRRRNRQSHAARTQAAETTDTTSRPTTSRIRLPWATRPIAPEDSGAERAPYGDSVPQQQSMYDWAPRPRGTDSAERIEIFRTLVRLRQEQPNTHPEVLTSLAQHHAGVVRQDRIAALEARQNELQDSAQADERQGQPTDSTIFRRRMEAHDHELRSAALLGGVRGNQALSPRSRNSMERYVVERDERRLDRESSSITESRRLLSAYRRLDHTLMEDTSRIADASLLAAREDLSDTEDGPEHSSPLRHYLNATRPRQDDQEHPRENPPPARREHLDTLRRSFLGNPTPKTVTSEFEKVIQYMHAMRDSDTDMDVPIEQTERNLRENYSSWRSAERLSMRTACPPHPSSWLVPGMTFSGTQRAAYSAPLTLHRPPPAYAYHPVVPVPVDPTRPWLGMVRESLIPQPIVASPESIIMPTPDRWVVKVTLHDVDYENMTLQGTMEAFNVLHPPGTADSAPVPPSPDRTTFSTYLTGELIDFQHHTLLTVNPSFPRTTTTTTTTTSTTAPATTADVDARYWRKLEPFSTLSDEDLARVLLDPDWLEREIAQKYVLMRWKERCFVAPTFEAREGTVWAEGRRPEVPRERGAVFLPGVLASPASQGDAMDVDGGTGAGAGGRPGVLPRVGGQFGLSISGFYYVSLRRSDGHLEGLYFDPHSVPYQHLKMTPERKAGGWMTGSAEVV